jgi:hypothetical protein
VSDEEKKAGIAWTVEGPILTTDYDQLIAAISAADPPVHDGLARRMKEEWAKVPTLSDGERRQALMFLEFAARTHEALQLMAELRTRPPEITAAELGEPAAAPPAPPTAGEALVGLFCKREMREAVLGDLDEKFAELAERRGPRIATAWYWSQAARSALFFAVRWGRRLLELETLLKRIL